MCSCINFQSITWCCLRLWFKDLPSVSKSSRTLGFPFGLHGSLLLRKVSPICLHGYIIFTFWLPGVRKGKENMPVKILMYFLRSLFPPTPSGYSVQHFTSFLLWVLLIWTYSIMIYDCQWEKLHSIIGSASSARRLESWPWAYKVECVCRDLLT